MRGKLPGLGFLAAAAVALLAGCGSGVQTAQPRRSVPSITGEYGETANAAAMKAADQAQALEANYYGHAALRLTNGLVTVVAVPDFGGRIMEYKLGEKPLLWVNLAQVRAAPTTTKPKSERREWINWGGYKVWPAPQDRWGGPPDPPGSDLEGARWVGRVTKPRGDVAEIELTSPADEGVTGLQMTRRVRLFVGTTHIQVVETFKNVSSRQIEWGIWDVTQVPGALSSSEAFSDQARIYFPVNADGRFKGGYRTIGDKTANEWRVENGILEVTYKHQTAKIGADSPGFWATYVDGAHGFTLAKRFEVSPQAIYPDGGCTVEVYTSGDLPYMELEVLGPLSKLGPKEETSFSEDWYATRVGGPTRTVDDLAAFSALPSLKRDGGKVTVTGTLGVFQPGKVRLALADDKGTELGKPWEQDVSPATAVKLNQSLAAAAGATRAVLSFVRPTGTATALSSMVFVPASATAAAAAGGGQK